MTDWVQTAVLSLGTAGIGGLAGTFFGPRVQDKVQEGRERREYRREQIMRWREGIAALSAEPAIDGKPFDRAALYRYVWFRELQAHLSPASNYGRPSGGRVRASFIVKGDDPYADMARTVDHLAREWGVDG